MEGALGLPDMPVKVEVGAKANLEVKTEVRGHFAGDHDDRR
jgi:hypothetical protein